MLKSFSPETLFVFIPSDEKEAQEKFEKANPGQQYPLFTILHTQMNGDQSTFYRSQLNDLLEQIQEVTGRGREQKTFIHNKADMRALRNLDLKMSRSLIKKATNFSIQSDHIEYPVMKDGKVVEEWCEDSKILDKLVEILPEDWLTDLIAAAREVSELTPYEKKR